MLGLVVVAGVLGCGAPDAPAPAPERALAPAPATGPVGGDPLDDATRVLEPVAGTPTGAGTPAGSPPATGAAPVPPRAPVVVGDAGNVDGSDAEAIAEVVRRAKGRIQTCVEASLRANPTLQGTVALGWTIADGRVTESRVVRDTTGDAALGGCLSKSVRGFRFPAGMNAEVAEFPFVVTPPG